MSDTVGNTPATATLLVGSGTTVGDLSPNGDVDWYKFDLIAGQTISAKMFASGATPADVRLEYYAANDLTTPLASSNSGQTLILQAADAGTYYVRVCDMNTGDNADEGAFTLTLDLSDSTGVTPAWASSATIGTAVLDSLSPDKDSDWYGYDLVAGQSYGFSVSGRNGSTLPGVALLLREANGNVVASSATGGLANFVPSADGRYYVDIVDLATDGVAGGDYRLDSWSLPLDEIAPANPRAILNGHALSSLIDVAPDSDRFALQAVAGATYYVRLQGNGGDPLPAGELKVYLKQGDTLTPVGTVSGATGGAGLAYSFTAPASGDYVLQAAGQGGTGGYTIEVTSTLARIDGTESDDVMTGRAEGNLMIGLGGNDRIDGGAGNDTIQGGLGDDTLIGGDGSDVLQLAGLGNASVDLLVTAAQNTGQGMDVISGFETVFGGAGDDRIFATNGDNRLVGGAGNDTLLGRDGADILRGDAGNDHLVGGVGLDVAEYFQAVDHLIDLRRTGAQDTGEGLDMLAGIEGLNMGAGNDTLIGNERINVLMGGAGNDSLYGMGGSDRLNGGEGNDLILAGDGGADVLMLTTAVNHVVDLRVTGGQQTGEGMDTIRGVEYLSDLVGFNDRFVGNDSANIFYGGAGNDTLMGMGGGDQLMGGAGNDRLNGGLGNDRLTGDAGADEFVFDPTSGRDRITDFEDGIDMIAIQGARAADLTLTQSGSNVIVSFGATAIIVADVTTADLTLDDFRFF